MIDSSILEQELANALSEARGDASTSDLGTQANLEMEPEYGTESDNSGAPAAGQGASVNWDDPEQNPYVSRFKGLQGSLQQQVETNQRLAAQMQQYEQVLTQFQRQQQEQQFAAQLAQLPQHEQQRQLDLYRTQQALEQERQQLQQAWAAVNGAARDVVSQKFAVEKGLTPDDVTVLNSASNGISDPRVMQLLVDLMSQVRQGSSVQKSQGFESVTKPSAPAPPRQPTTNWDEADNQFIAAMERLNRG